jgi:NAD-dependent SIR2 family protein deacetylase
MTEETIFNSYSCGYCKNKFKANSGKITIIDEKIVKLCNTIKCPNCGNFLKNRIVEKE